MQIFAAYARGVSVEFIAGDLEQFYDRKYGAESPGSCYHPKYLLDFIGSYCEFNGISKVATLEMLERAWDGVFTVD